MRADRYCGQCTQHGLYSIDTVLEVDKYQDKIVIESKTVVLVSLKPPF